MKNPNAIISSDYGPIIINVNDSVIGKHIGKHGYWAIDDLGLIRQLVEMQLQKFGQVTFYDVGANIGTHTLAMVKTFAGKIKLRAFEAQRQIYNMLCGTMALNGIGHAFCHNNAVSAVSGETLEIGLLDYHSANNFGALELMAPQRSDQQAVVKTSTEQVKTVNLDSFKERVDFIKIDIEGMEDQALRGATQAIDAHRPICFIEVHKTDTDFVMNYFRGRNYAGFLRGIDLIAIPFDYQMQVNNAQRVF